ncbi:MULTISPECIES: hypothetical protein [Sphingomonas]|uniref:hypothetical protein n=1 Tax=Sphingomonas TaxID=13687 RepID=UPI0013B3A038|nr:MULTISPECIES: hypothetical protein [Sphingomonas]
MRPLVRLAAPAQFGRGRAFILALPRPEAPLLSADAKLFLTAYAAAFLVVSAWIA